MSLKSFSILVFHLAIPFILTGQGSINFHPNSLSRELRKVGISEMDLIQEFQIPDSIVSTSNINGKFFYLKKHNDTYKYIYVGRVNSCRSGGCSVSNIAPRNEGSEYFDYYILFDSTKTVQKVKVYNYQATHGQEVSAKGWLKQFIGHKSNSPLEVGKNIDAISGATISVYSLTVDLEYKTVILSQLRD